MPYFRGGLKVDQRSYTDPQQIISYSFQLMTRHGEPLVSDLVWSYIKSSTFNLQTKLAKEKSSPTIGLSTPNNM